jgi:hypothetical protein
MSERFRPDPDQFQQSVDLLCTKIQTVAVRAGMSEVDCEDLERSLAAMPPVVRDRVKLMLNGIEIQTEYDDPTMCFAARYLLRLAQNIWGQSLHPVTHATHGARNHSRPS